METAQQHLHGCSALIPQQGTKQSTQLSRCEEAQDLERKPAGFFMGARKKKSRKPAGFFTISWGPEKGSQGSCKGPELGSKEPAESISQNLLKIPNRCTETSTRHRMALPQFRQFPSPMGLLTYTGRRSSMGHSGFLSCTHMILIHDHTISGCRYQEIMTYQNFQVLAGNFDSTHGPGSSSKRPC